MKKVEDFEAIRRAYFVDKLSICEINCRFGYHRETIRKAIANPAPQPYRLKKPRDAPVIGAYKQRIAELLEKSKHQPCKQRYTGHRIYEILVGEGYRGSAGSVLNYVSQERRKRKRQDAYLPLEFDPGSQRVYITENFGDEPAVHVYQMQVPVNGRPIYLLLVRR